MSSRTVVERVAGSKLCAKKLDSVQPENQRAFRSDSRVKACPHVRTYLYFDVINVINGFVSAGCTV